MIDLLKKYIKSGGDGSKERFNIGTGGAKWQKVTSLKVGDKIAIVHPASVRQLADEKADLPAQAGLLDVPNENEVIFDEIVSIKKVGSEQVWDIEVEGTHNFVGNGILAHNTYITGNLGVGTTAPTSKLTIDKSLPNSNELLFNVKNTGNDVFSVDAEGDYLYTGTASSPAADYAEYFATKDTDLQAGEAVCIDVLNPNSVVRCSREFDSNIMGIVSSKPALVGNARPEYVNNKNYKAIAMLGQIPARVSTENGDVRIGDSLTASSTPGYLMKANAGDSTVGVALESFRPAADIETAGGDKGTIQVMISRRNKSLTVEAVEAKVTERVAAMKIEDEVNLLVANAVASLKPANTLTLDVNGNVTLTDDPTKTVNILANNAEIRNITDSLITLQSDYETLKNTTEERIAKIESTILTSVFEKEYKAEEGVQVAEIVSFDGAQVVKASGENRDMILGVVTGVRHDELVSASKATVTTRGRVKVQVTKENGEVKKGDAITGSTEKAGLGTKAISEGMIIGYALEDARPDADIETEGGDIETVEIAISPVWYVAGARDALNGQGNVGTGTMLSISELTVEKDTLLSGNLNVLGSANFTDIFTSGKVSIGLLTLNSTDNSINVIADTLNLQNDYGAGDITAFGGKIVLTSNGSIKVLAEVTAKKYNVDISDVKAASAGRVTVKSGEKEIIVETSALTKDSLIFVTAEDSTSTFSYEITADNRIRIYTGAEVDKDTNINWWIVN
jgi:hypothetical protein